MAELCDISGLRLKELAPKLASAADSPHHIYLDESRPVNIVFHGHGREFGYEYYGIHRGTEDRLTFIGPRPKGIRSYFIDCREDSKTWGVKFETELFPDVARVLIIPPGVAHTFDGLDEIYTLNSFRNFLPHPDDWISGKVEWGLSADTINLPRDTSKESIPRVSYNRLEASEQFYSLTSRNISLQQTDLVQEYPLSKRINFSDGTSKLVKFRRNANRRTAVPKREAVPGIEGLCWLRRPFVIGSDGFDAGYTTFLSPARLTVFDRGANEQVVRSECTGSRGSKAITLFGPTEAQATISIRHSDGASVVLYVSPSPLRELFVPEHCSFEISDLTNVVVVVRDGALVASTGSA